MKGSMHRLPRSHRRLSRTALTLLLVIQALGGGAVTLAHARDVVTAPAHVETSHDARCPVLHDALRCALCHYAGAQVVVQGTVIVPAPNPTRARLPSTCQVIVVSSTAYRTAPARAPPTLLS
jgi:hypothetical protein